MSNWILNERKLYEQPTTPFLVKKVTKLTQTLNPLVNLAGFFLYKNMNDKQPGWRFFDCDGCGFKWKDPTTDMHAQTGVTCPECSDVTFPHRCAPDPLTPTDKLGNHIPSQTVEEPTSINDILKTIG